MKLLIGLVGERLAGKDTVAEYIAHKYNGVHLKYSKIMDEILDILDLPKSRRNEMDISNALRKTFHDNVWWDAIKKKALSSASQVVVINGNRFPDEYAAAKAIGVKMIYITAPTQILYERFEKRSEKADDSKMTRKQFEELENEPTERNIKKLGAEAEFKIENTGSVEDLYLKVDKIINTLNKN